MPYIKTSVREGAFITDLTKILEGNNWTVGQKFYKVGIPVAQLGNPTGTISDTTVLSFAVAQHQQFKNAKGAVYALARVLEVKIAYKELPAIFKTKANVLDEAKKKEMHDFVFSKWPEEEDNTTALDNTKIYTYMAEKETGILSDSEYLFASNGTVASVLDAELTSYKARITTVGNSTNVLEIIFDESVLNDGSLVTNNPLVMQSPITEMKMRIANETGWATNWWPDSLVTVNGWIDSEVVALILQGDKAAAPDDAFVPTVPLYWGSVTSLDTTSDGKIDHALFAGTAPLTMDYDFDSTAKFVTSPMLPTVKAYPKFPSNGIDDITIMRTRQGSYYQKHFIKAYNPPNKMPPDRKNGNKQFPSAWKNNLDDEYTYPAVSAYTDNKAISPILVEHAEERSRGDLKKIMVVSSPGLYPGADLQVAKGTCPETYEYYKVFDIDAISPLTKRPATQYRPMMIAIYEGDAPQ